MIACLQWQRSPFLVCCGFERRSHALNVIHGVVDVRGWMDASDQPSSGVATRPSYSLQVNIGGTGRCAIYALRAATAPSSSLIFSAGSASSSIAYLRLVSLGSGSPNLRSVTAI